MLRWDRGLLGQEFSRYEQHVTREMILEYADIIGVTAPVHRDAQAARARGYKDIIAPSTFVTWRGAHPIAPPAMGFSGTGINAGYACTFSGVNAPSMITNIASGSLLGGMATGRWSGP